MVPNAVVFPFRRCESNTRTEFAVSPACLTRNHRKYSDGAKTLGTDGSVRAAPGGHGVSPKEIVAALGRSRQSPRFRGFSQGRSGTAVRFAGQKPPVAAFGERRVGAIDKRRQVESLAGNA